LSRGAINTSEAIVVGNKIIKAGNTVRVGYDREDNTFMAHMVLKIEKR